MSKRINDGIWTQSELFVVVFLVITVVFLLPNPWTILE